MDHVKDDKTQQSQHLLLAQSTHVPIDHRVRAAFHPAARLDVDSVELGTRDEEVVTSSSQQVLQWKNKPRDLAIELDDLSWRLFYLYHIRLTHKCDTTSSVRLEHCPSMQCPQKDRPKAPCMRPRESKSKMTQHGPHLFFWPYEPHLFLSLTQDNGHSNLGVSTAGNTQYQAIVSE